MEILHHPCFISFPHLIPFSHSLQIIKNKKKRTLYDDLMVVVSIAAMSHFVSNFNYSFIPALSLRPCPSHATLPKGVKNLLPLSNMAYTTHRLHDDRYHLTYTRPSYIPKVFV